MRAAVSVFCVLSAGLLVGCGDGRGDAPAPAPDAPKAQAPASSLYLASKAELPKCDAARKSTLAYVIDESIFYGCDGKAWQEVETGGASQVVEATRCVGERDFQGKALRLRYVTTTMSTGDRHVNCVVENGATAVSHSELFSEATPAAFKGTCILNFDLDDASFGYMTFEGVQGGGYAAKYGDTPSPLNGTEFAFKADECKKATY